MRFFRVVLAIILYATASTGTLYAREVFPSFSVLPVLMYDIERGKKTLIATGSGFVVDGKERYLVTAKHNLYADEGRPAILFTVIKEKPCMLEVVRVHKITDASLMRFRCDTKLISRLVPLSRSTETPMVGERMSLYGFQLPDRIFGNKRCGVFLAVRLCERIAPLTISHVNAATKDFATTTAEKEGRALDEAKKRDPKTTYGDLFFSAYLVANHPKVLLEELFTGTSGGALVDQRGRVAGIMVGETSLYLAFIPIRELPKELFDE